MALLPNFQTPGYVPLGQNPPAHGVLHLALGTEPVQVWCVCETEGERGPKYVEIGAVFGASGSCNQG